MGNEGDRNPECALLMVYFHKVDAMVLFFTQLATFYEFKESRNVEMFNFILLELLQIMSSFSPTSFIEKESKTQRTCSNLCSHTVNQGPIGKNLFWGGAGHYFLFPSSHHEYSYF